MELAAADRPPFAPLHSRRGNQAQKDDETAQNHENENSGKTEPETAAAENPTRDNSVLSHESKGNPETNSSMNPLTRSSTRKANEELNIALFSQMEPQSVKEVFDDPSWVEAMEDELHEFENNQSVEMCSRFQLKLKESHLSAVKRIIRYVHSTFNFGLWYPKIDDFSAVGYCDTNFAGEIVDRRSTSGLCCFLGKSLNVWSSKKQSTVALSTTEAEYIDASSYCSQLM
ncbi:uncharacterized protein LOC107641547 [Arachis ipaensis]|uniref:uncharacterized protein LOC107641547 n=1 Tax=Arachis ipaensis TaxID=130454 RepID=UPI0007AF3E0B|nr:uncharacterized protein LOC107641547 [Arachis ipaensis]